MHENTGTHTEKSNNDGVPFFSITKIEGDIKVKRKVKRK